MNGELSLQKDLLRGYIYTHTHTHRKEGRKEEGKKGIYLFVSCGIKAGPLRYGTVGFEVPKVFCEV